MNSEKIIQNIINKNINTLYNYKYIEDKDLKNINTNVFIKYVSKNNFIIKTGFLRNKIHDNIFELSCGNKKWFIYINKYYFFIKINKKDQLRITLEKLIESDFKDITFTKN